MFIYLLQTAINKGFVPKEEYQPVVDQAYKGIPKKVVINSDGFINLTDCSSIGVMHSYEEYISQPREISTFAAYGSFILGTGIVELVQSR
jgi:rhamnogalacturonyl hydrolase YesR